MVSQTQKDQFLNIIQQNMKLIFKVCNTYCHDTEDRKDLVQEVIVQLWRSFGNYNNQFKLSTWMYRVALNTAISWYRSESKRKGGTVKIEDGIIDLIDINDQLETDQQIQQLYDFINQFNELNRALMILYLDNNSYREIADVLGITETNVATKISRIKLQLKQQFAKI